VAILSSSQTSARALYCAPGSGDRSACSTTRCRSTATLRCDFRRPGGGVGVGVGCGAVVVAVVVVAVALSVAAAPASSICSVSRRSRSCTLALSSRIAVMNSSSNFRAAGSSLGFFSLIAHTRVVFSSPFPKVWGWFPLFYFDYDNLARCWRTTSVPASTTSRESWSG
jgi:hypothetical protein